MMKLLKLVSTFAAMKFDSAKAAHRLLRSLEALSYVSVIAGILVAFIEYRDAKEEKAVQNALSYVQGFHSNEISASKQWLEDRWLDIPLSRISGLPGSADVIDGRAMDIIFPMDETPRATHLVRVLDYLDVVASCASHNICASETIMDFFAAYSESMLCLYAAPIARLRSEHALSTIGLATEELMKNDIDCEK